MKASGVPWERRSAARASTTSTAPLPSRPFVRRGLRQHQLALRVLRSPQGQQQRRELQAGAEGALREARHRCPAQHKGATSTASHHSTGGGLVAPSS